MLAGGALLLGGLGMGIGALMLQRSIRLSIETEERLRETMRHFGVMQRAINHMLNNVSGEVVQLMVTVNAADERINGTEG